MSWKGVEKPVAGRPIRSAWGVGVVEALDELYYRQPPFSYGYLSGHIIPEIDLIYSIGKPTLRIKHLHVGYIYITYAGYIGNKPIDPPTDTIDPILALSRRVDDLEKRLNKLEEILGKKRIFRLW